MKASAPRRSFDAPLAAWFAAQGWKPAPFQRDAWRRYLRGESGLLVTPTGSGKTLAAFGGPLLEALEEMPALASSAASAASAPKRKRAAAKDAAPVARILWVTPLRALAADTLRALQSASAALGLTWRIAMRTGDASARDRSAIRRGRAEVIVITPESLALLLTYPETADQFSALRAVVVDEWHELVGNKRGVLLQLSLARLRAWAPRLRLWGLSATLGNLEEARDALLPHAPEAAIIAAAKPRPLVVRTLLPEEDERFPWAGHLGLRQLARVKREVDIAHTSLIFTNTRSQAELWHQALAAVWVDDLGSLALHHGSLDGTVRARAEQGLRDGSVRCVVATSSLDLGVDFPAVDCVIQIGSPKGIARLIQRGGRARHRPGEAGDILCVPTHAFELIEYAAARRALAAGKIEARPPPRLCLDVLAQHCISIALGGGFDADALYAEVVATHAFRTLSLEQWQDVLDFIVKGGRALEHYPEHRRVERQDDGRYAVVSRAVAYRHRLSVGTIASDGSIAVKFLKGGNLGSVEESFIGRLRPGQRFQFAGKTLELVRLENMAAYVRIAKSANGTVPRWQGGRMPLSSELGREVEAMFAAPAHTPEMRAVAGALALQARMSALPAPGSVLAERVASREGAHLFLYPFAGRAVHEGLAALLAARWARAQPKTFAYAVNDYGLVLTSDRNTEIDHDGLARLLTPVDLAEDLRASLNMSELARRQFREIARVAGLLPPSLPGRAARTLRQLQASSGLLYDVLQRYDPDHLLLSQAEREVMEHQLDYRAMFETLANLSERRILLMRPRTLTPLSFPLWAESIRGHLSSEDWKTRVRRAAEALERRNG
jgi:ATP-dependent helicase Lhr and Lhr-like helicase